VPDEFRNMTSLSLRQSWRYTATSPEKGLGRHRRTEVRPSGSCTPPVLPLQAKSRESLCSSRLRLGDEFALLA
jgi:hypothetical protein